QLHTIRQEVLDPEIGKAEAATRGLEASGLRNEPIVQIAAVQCTHHSEPLWICDALRDEMIDARHYVLVVGFAPRVDDHPLTRFAVPGATARHRKQHGESRTRQRFGRIRIDLRYEVHKLREQSV